MSQNLIEFHWAPDQPGYPFPEPFPAARDIPDRIKRMPAVREMGDQSVKTVKKCPPFLDAMASGYLIPMVADVQFRRSAEMLEFTSSIPCVFHHLAEQLTDNPRQELTIVKIISPWIIKTPPGYSCLFTQPLNRFQIPFQVLNGVVETDKFYFEIHFPMICLLGPGQAFNLARGTPIVQVIPFKRDDWKSQIGPADVARRSLWDSTRSSEEGNYKADYWERKSYE